MLKMPSVYLMIKHKKTCILTDVKESASVYELKRIVQGILNKAPEEQRLFYNDKQLDDRKTLKSCGINNKNAKPEDPVKLALELRLDNGSFEKSQMVQFSKPGVNA